MYPADLEVRDELSAWPEVLSPGGSAIYGPLGDRLAGPLWNEEGVLLAELDMSAIPRSKFDFDVTGHYARPDVFRLSVDESPHPPVG
jgi:nitrilase